VARVFGGLDAETAIARLREAGVAYGAVNDVAGLSCHAQLRRVTAGTPTGTVDLPAFPAIFSGQPTTLPDVPALGSSTARVRAEFAVA
jgi:crotonobetainyl-CoA:carnitine CoA-transferase CaiB-like acyl-CoA transferase